jgi:uncharacterized protein YoxC
MPGRFLLIDEDDVDPAIFQAVADIRKAIQHLKSAFARLAHTDDDQPPTAHQVSQEPMRVIMRQQRNTGINHVNPPANACERSVSHDLNAETEKTKEASEQTIALTIAEL